jgi:hypothetical protein
VESGFIDTLPAEHAGMLWYMYVTGEVHFFCWCYIFCLHVDCFLVRVESFCYCLFLLCLLLLYRCSDWDGDLYWILVDVGYAEGGND